MTTNRILLSPPDVGEAERAMLLAAFDSGWIAPLGPHVDAFEAEFAAAVGLPHAAALASGTAAIHLALRLVGVEPGDEVFVSTLTFVASAAPIVQLGARPVFVDSERSTWNMDPQLLADALAERARVNRLPRAVLVVDVLGQCADWEPITEVCDHYGVPIVEDAAEALGATWQGRAAGTFGRLGVFSFNGNKIITTSGGGMLVGHDGDLIARARWLASQAREPAAHYEHRELGYNYRLSNLLAGVGRAQLASLPDKVARRRAIKRRYRQLLGELPGIGFMPDDPRGEASNWLSVLTVDAELFGCDAAALRHSLDAVGIEARPAWKPLHMQPVFQGADVVGGRIAEQLFGAGLCLPSGSRMSDTDVDRVADAVVAATR